MEYVRNVHIFQCTYLTSKSIYENLFEKLVSDIENCEVRYNYLLLATEITPNVKLIVPKIISL